MQKADHRRPQNQASGKSGDARHCSPEAEVLENVESEEIIPADHVMVQQMRAASVYVCDLASKYSGAPINQLDAALWNAMKDGSLKELQNTIQENAKAQGRKITNKHMLVPTFNF